MRRVSRYEEFAATPKCDFTQLNKVLNPIYINVSRRSKVEPRIGVYICHCVSNIAGTVDSEEVTRLAQVLNSVVVTRNNKFKCSGPDQNLIKEQIIAADGGHVGIAKSRLDYYAPNQLILTYSKLIRRKKIK